MILLNPGPVNVSERVRQALLKPETVREDLGWAAHIFMSQRIPVALLVTKGVLS